MAILFNVCISLWASFYAIDVDLVHSIISVESNYNHLAVAMPEGSYGLMQVRRKYVQYSRRQLLKPCLNIKVGTKILYEAKLKCSHQVDYSYVLCYNRGVKGATKVKNYKKDSYYQKVMQQLRRRKYGKKNARLMEKS